MDRSAVVGIVEQAIDFLETDRLLLAHASQREDLLKRCRTLLEQAREPGELLYVGILGGTGVGKSTLINALAGEEISQSSDRRPFTDKAVVYRHKETRSGLNEISHLIRRPDAEHESDPVRALVLLDLPDFDSIEEENRRGVLQILPRLDCVVWVVSPEKYADDVFYRLVSEAAINREHFTFVLNKADELRDHGNDPHSRVKDVLGDLTFRLRNEAGIEQPRIFSISANQEFSGAEPDPVLAREFSRFRDFLMSRRNAKEIASVKTSNLVEKTGRLLADLHKLIGPEEKVKLLKSVRAIDTEGTEVAPEADPGIQEHKKKIESLIFRELIADDSSIGPVKWALNALVWARGNLGRRGTELSVHSAFHGAARLMSERVRSDLERFTDRVDSELILSLGGLESAGMRGGFQDALEHATNRAYRLFGQECELQRNALVARFARWRRFRQKLVMFVPLPILIMKLAGLPRMESWWDQPTVWGALGMIVAFLTSLFSADGLVGLCVLLICELLLAWFLASRRIRKIERQADGLAESAIAHMAQGLKAVAEQARAARQQTVHGIEEGINRLDTLESAFESAETK